MDLPPVHPERTTPEQAAAESGDELSEEERSALHDSLSRGWDEAQAGALIPAGEVLARLRSAKGDRQS